MSEAANRFHAQDCFCVVCQRDRYRKACDRFSDALLGLTDAAEQIVIQGEIGRVEEFEAALDHANDLLAGEAG